MCQQTCDISYNNISGNDARARVDGLAGGMYIGPNTTVVLESATMSHNEGYGIFLSSPYSNLTLNGAYVRFNTGGIGCSGVYNVYVSKSMSYVCGNDVDVYGCQLPANLLCDGDVDDLDRGTLIDGGVLLSLHSSNWLINASDSIISVYYGSFPSQYVVMHDDGGEIDARTPQRTRNETGPVFVVSAYGRQSLTQTEYLFTDYGTLEDGCIVTAYNATPPATLLYDDTIVHVWLNNSCGYDVLARCNVSGTLSDYDSTRNGDLRCVLRPRSSIGIYELQVIVMRHPYDDVIANSSSPLTLEYYDVPVVTSASPDVAHDNITIMTVCGKNMLRYIWATPECVFDDGSISRAIYGDDDDGPCVRCKFKNMIDCSTMPSSTVSVQLEKNQYHLSAVRITSLCLPSQNDLSYSPHGFPMADDDDVVVIKAKSPTRFAVGSVSSKCKFGNSLGTASILSDDTMECRVPAGVDAKNVMLSISLDGQTWVDVCD